jgi:hypothetical protein
MAPTSTNHDREPFLPTLLARAYWQCGQAAARGGYLANCVGFEGWLKFADQAADTTGQAELGCIGEVGARLKNTGTGRTRCERQILLQVV